MSDVIGPLVATGCYLAAILLLAWFVVTIDERWAARRRRELEACFRRQRR